MANQQILLIVSGGIAAYRSLDIARRLRERGVAVRMLLTRAAEEFITPLSATVLSGQAAMTDLFSPENEADIGHIELSRSADLLLVAPASADLLAKMANGLADDLASTVLLATDTPVLVAPAMNVRMWEHSATRRNVNQLRADGIGFIGPDDGAMACGEFGPGRLAEVDAIVDAATSMLGAHVQKDGEPATKTSDTTDLLDGNKILVTAGPTHEPIDPVRYIANRSSGKQGYAIAAAAARAGAEVTLVSGPTALATPPGVRRVDVESARDMQAAVVEALSDGHPFDAGIFAAAVADWRTADIAEEKMKKRAGAEVPP
ncbi:MAG: bifunctional phosphopantothenoylcysteine decarboxylase/phosphopantothenate--cysteine ligase CoaBC, partial [Planctomycetota bacterium]